MFAGQRPWQTAELNKWLLACSDVEMESNESTIKTSMYNPSEMHG